MDPLTVVVGAAAVAGAATAWRMRSRAVRAEAKAAELRSELHAERHAASHDALTGLPNRRAFYQLGASLVTNPARHPLVAVVLDLDDFKEINDQFGHAAGDHVLIIVAQRFALCAGDNLVARLGGDEFAGLLSIPAVDGPWLDEARRRFVDGLAESIQIAGRNVRVTASVGLAPVTGSHLAEALCQADAAMYRAKSTGQGLRWASAPDDDFRCHPDVRPPGRAVNSAASRVGQAAPSPGPARHTLSGGFVHSALAAEA
jgi:diguanylate cyclase (GGDEF)-like protein